MLPEDCNDHWHDEDGFSSRALFLSALAALIGLVILVGGAFFIFGSPAPQTEQHGEAR